jgi:hypothetical protein|tara:strand:+ start:3388 stop:3642 length:255 start_codon:yes stop_codon:yes gene_type:complete
MVVGSSPTEPTTTTGEKMTYTVIYEEKDTGNMNTLTFVSQQHCKNHAWIQFEEEYAKDGQIPVMIMPGNHIVYFASDISFTNVA